MEFDLITFVLFFLLLLLLLFVELLEGVIRKVFLTSELCLLIFAECETSSVPFSPFYLHLFFSSLVPVLLNFNSIFGALSSVCGLGWSLWRVSKAQTAFRLNCGHFALVTELLYTPPSCSDVLKLVLSSGY